MAPAPLKVLETERLVLRWLTTGDAGFILRLVNEPAWKAHIGDYGVRTLEDAEELHMKGPALRTAGALVSTWLNLRETGTPVGICGLIKRESLEDVDLGYALLEEFWGKGYALSQLRRSWPSAGGTFQLPRIVAVSSTGNAASTRLLEKLGFHFERRTRLKADADEVSLYALGL